MEHLEDYIDQLRPVPVPFILNEQEEDIANILSDTDFGYQSFDKFLQDRNWSRTQEGGLDKSLTPSKTNDYIYDKNEILQAWLFFGLLACIVRTDKPLFRVADLVKGSAHNRFLNTKTLPEHLQTWHDWVKTSLDRTQVQERLIDADRTLELARRVVRANFVPARYRSEMDISFSGAGDDLDEAISMNGTSDYEISSDIESDEEDPGERHQSELGLCLMLLGETLSAAKTQIMNDLGLRIHGWLTDDDAGWGPPAYVLAKMKDNRWCPRAQTVLLGRLGSSAILLFVAFEKHFQRVATHQHENCTTAVCFEMPGRSARQVTRGDEEGIGAEKSYVPQHHKQNYMCMPRRCELRGPKMKDVFRILEEAKLVTEAYDFPLFRIISEHDPNEPKNGRYSRVLGVTVEKWSREAKRELRRPSFATISHVWSQGMGNESSNRLQECQLKFIRMVLEEAEIEDKDGKEPEFVSSMVKKALGDQYKAHQCKLSPPFWMDTLAIPVSDKAASTEYTPVRFLELKQRAIRQIYHVYNHATRVVVIDKELCQTHSLDAASMIIQVLTSAWMRRLWTLQEAFLSRRLLVAFKRGIDGIILQDVDSCISKLGTFKDGTESGAFKTAMDELIKTKLYHNLMGEDREIRNRKDHPIETRGSMVIVSAWRSSRWRSTSRLEDETLALATLLNLDYRATTIERGGDKGGMAGKDLRERMMRDFWTLIHRSYEGSIPAGLIFLPGERLSIPGFGWAPATWLSGKDEAHPYPLNVIGKPTELHQEGLLVQYPGFLLHGGDPDVILRSNYLKEDLIFPIDRYLSEWYRATAIEEPSHDQAAQNVITRVRLDAESGQSPPKRPQFGIILSRPKPREWPAEIGLLVEIYSEMWRRKEPQRVNRKIYCCQIIRRLRVSRAVKPPESGFQVPSGKRKDSPIGELMLEDTLWYVDGYQDSKTREESRRPGRPMSGDDRIGTVNDNLDAEVSEKLGLGFFVKRREPAVDAKDSVGSLPGRRNSAYTSGASRSYNRPSLDRSSSSASVMESAGLQPGGLKRFSTGFSSFFGSKSLQQPLAETEDD